MLRNLINSIRKKHRYFQCKPPQEPKPEDCCQLGCERCVWVIYWEELEKWKKRNNKK